MILRALAATAAAGLYLWRRRAAARHERECASRLPVGADGIIPGAAPIDLAGDGSRAVLLYHGFGDTPQTLAYLAAHLHAHGWSVRVPLLPGHGRTLRDFAQSGAADWLARARAELTAMQERHGRVALGGLSMGGSLATILAADYADAPALVLLAPYLAMPAALSRLAAMHWAWGSVAPYVIGRDERSIHDPDERARSLAYGACSPRLLGELARVVDLARAAAPRVRCPTLVVQSREDNRISAAAAREAFERFGAAEKHLEWIDGAGHVISVDYGRDLVIQLVRDWLEASYRSRSEESGREAGRAT